MVHTVCANYCLRYVHSIRSVHVDSSTYSTDLCRIDDLTCLCETFSRIHYLLDCVAFDSLSIESCKTILSKRMGCPLSHAVCVCCVSRRNYSDQLNLSGCSMNFLTCTRFSFFFWSVIEHFTSPHVRKGRFSKPLFSSSLSVCRILLIISHPCCHLAAYQIIPHDLCHPPILSPGQRHLHASTSIRTHALRHANTHTSRTPDISGTDVFKWTWFHSHLAVSPARNAYILSGFCVSRLRIMTESLSRSGGQKVAYIHAILVDLVLQSTCTVSGASPLLLCVGAVRCCMQCCGIGLQWG